MELPSLKMLTLILSSRNSFFSSNINILHFNDTITESRRNFFQSSLFRLTKQESQISHIPRLNKKESFECLREIEISNSQEERRTRHKDVVVVLVNVCKGTWAGFGDCFEGLEVIFSPGKEDELTADVDNEVGRSGQAHDFASHVDG